MTIKRKIVTIFGGSGFIGRHVVRYLAAEGYAVKVASRIPEAAHFLKTNGAVGQIVPVPCDYTDPASLREAIAGADIVINCVGILYQTRRNGFRRIHAELPGMIAEAAARENVARFVHISALGAGRGRAQYAQTKKVGEDAVLAACPWATILRPSVVFGPEDNFFNMFARLSRFAPVMPLIGGGKTKFQPVYVGDVAHAVMAAVMLPPFGEADPRGKVYELGGPEIVDFREIYRMLFKFTNRRRRLVRVPFWLMKVKAFFLSLLPRPLLTPDQVESLKTDNVVSPDALTLAHLGIAPTGMGLILPSYLEAYRTGGRFADKKTA